MANNADKPLDFKFDTSNFETAMNKMNQKLNSFQKIGKNIANGISQGFNKVVGTIAKIGIAIKAVQGAMSQIPEVGQAFGIAKDIMLKNLLYPLRKELFPLLQKMLDWVRDNRVQFIKWGRVVANVFGIVGSMVVKLIDTGKRLVEGFMGFIGRVFGTPVQNLEKLINLLTFKLSVALTFLGNLIDTAFTLLEPLFSVIGEAVETVLSAISEIVDSLLRMVDGGASIQRIFEKVLNIVTDIAKFIVKITQGFLKGFLPKFKELEKPIGNIFDNIEKLFGALDKIVEALFTGEEALKFWSSAFEVIGNIVGTVLVEAFKIIDGLINGITEGIEAIIDFFENFDPGRLLDDIGKGFGDFFTGVGDFFTGGAPAKRVNDAIIRPDGTVIETAPDDTLIATKTPGSLGGRTVSISFGDILLNIPSGDIPRETAVNLATDFVDQVRIQLDREFVREGL